MRECDDSESEVELVETAKTIENGGQATVDNLELNLGTSEEPHAIYISSFLTTK